MILDVSQSAIWSTPSVEKATKEGPGYGSLSQIFAIFTAKNAN